MRRDRDLKEKSFGAAWLKPYAQAAVVIDAHVIAGALYFRQMPAKFIQGEGSASALDGFSKIVIEAAIDESAQPAVHCGLGPAWLEDHAMLGPSDVGICLERMDRAICGCMGQAQVRCYESAL